MAVNAIENHYHKGMYLVNYQKTLLEKIAEYKSKEQLTVDQVKDLVDYMQVVTMSGFLYTECVKCTGKRTVADVDCYGYKMISGNEIMVSKSFHLKFRKTWAEIKSQRTIILNELNMLLDRIEEVRMEEFKQPVGDLLSKLMNKR
jgi:hypothetical protein